MSFSEKSSIHGLKYLALERAARSEKIFWKVSLVMVSCMFAVLCYKTVAKFSSGQSLIRLSKRQFGVSEIPFPAVTFCPDLLIVAHNISPSLELPGMLDYPMPLGELYSPLGHDFFQQFYENFTFSAESLLPELRRRLQLEWFTNCVFIEWMGQYSIKVRTVLTRHGYCFSFNMRPIETLLHSDMVAEAFLQSENLEMNCLMESFAKNQSVLEEAMPWSTKAASDGLFVKFDRSADCGGQPGQDFMFVLRYNRQNYLQPLEGFYMIVHSPDEYPVNHGSQHNEVITIPGGVVISPEMFLLDDDLKSWPIKKRNCYLPGEKNLTFFKIYTKGNCEHECLSQAIEDQCGCLPFNVIGSRSRKFCDISQKDCRDKALESFHINRKQRTQECGCLNQCEYVNYKVSVKAGNKGSATDRVTLRIVFLSDHFYPFIETLAFGVTDFLGALGGLMGLFAGVSVISTIEVVVHFSKLMLKKLSNRRSMKIEVVQAWPTSTVVNHGVGHRIFEYLIDIISRSGIHGPHLLLDRGRKIWERIFWSLVVFLLAIFCSVEIAGIVKHSEVNPIEFGMDEKVWTINDIPFPAVTYCPGMNGGKSFKYTNCLDTRKVESSIKNSCWRFNSESLEQNKSSEYIECSNKVIEMLDREREESCAKFDSKMVDLLSNRTQALEEFLPLSLLCTVNHIYLFKDRNINLVPPVLDKLRHFAMPEKVENQSFCYGGLRQLDFQEVLTDRGICYAFNRNAEIFDPQRVSPDFLEYKTISSQCNDQNAMSKMKTFTFDSNFDLLFTCQRNGGIRIHNPEEFYSTNFIAVRAFVFSRILLNPKITTTDDALRKYSPKIRNCYFGDEGSLRYFTKYSLGSCLHECRSNMAMEACGCVLIYTIRGKDDKICHHEDKKCVESAWTKSETNLEEACGCLPECNKIDYDFEVIDDKREWDQTSFSRSPVSASIYFKSEEFIAFRRFESIDTVSLLSQIGGLLGLFLGISVLSVVETAYFVTLRLFHDLWKLIQSKS